MLEFRTAARALKTTLFVLAASVVALGCTCSSQTAGLDGAIPSEGGGDPLPGMDGGRPIPGDVGVTCDMTTGEGCPCPEDGLERACSTGGVGACGMGLQQCTIDFELPAWGACVGMNEVTDEVCNGVDDDCDGSIDEELGEVSCGVGPCGVTIPACVAGVEQSCVPLPAGEETCDGTDEDCDGTVDEGFGVLTCGVGACRSMVDACIGGVPQTCVPDAASAETCNGVDDDCDDVTDEGLGSLSCGEGECARSVAACSGGTPGVCVPGMMTMELCDGLDNDCDGAIDNGFGTTVCGLGECRRVVLDCDGGGGGACIPGTPVPEACDGLDNDCDEATDEEIADVSCGVGACFRTGPGCVGGEATICRPGTPTDETCDGVDNDCDEATDEGIPDRTCGVGECRRTVAGCSDGTPGICVPGTPVAEICGNGLDDDCNGVPDDLCGCDITVDNDFDTFNECVDCDDANGGVFPGRMEVCNGVDEDCDGLVDEDFDVDGDTFATCTTDPRLRDCDDSSDTVYPGAPEDCGPDGTGNGIDDDCNGYIDDGCAPCTTTDEDGDSITECDGDCDDFDSTRSPLAEEVCDGLDNDCNIFTVDNCGVSEPCRNPDGTEYAEGTDACEPDLLCGCVIGASGTCRDEYICTSYCQGSYTGDELGGGCSATQTCQYRITLTNNQHGCGEQDNPVGTLGAGEPCADDSECRSLSCVNLALGGRPNRRCSDFCDHHEPGADGSCADGTVCEVLSLGGFMSAPSMYAVCRLDDNGTATTGEACGDGCLWGTDSCVSGLCAEPCGQDSHCPSGYHCSVNGTSTVLGTFTDTAEPEFLRGEDAIETVPVCLTNTGTGLHNRQAGGACTRNSDCVSEFCEASLGICIALCTTDSSCPTGLTCEPNYVRANDGIFSGRVCLSSPVDALLQAM